MGTVFAHYSKHILVNKESSSYIFLANLFQIIKESPTRNRRFVLNELWVVDVEVEERDDLVEEHLLGREPRTHDGLQNAELGIRSF